MSSGQLKWWGESYSVRVRFADGKRKWIALPKGLSHKEAEARAKEIAESARNQTSIEAVRAIAKPGETFSEWQVRWLKHREAQGLESVRDDRSRLKTHVVALLGPVEMRAISVGHIEDVRDGIDAKIKSGDLSWKTGQNVWTIVRAVFRDARASKNRALRVRQDDPCSGVAPPEYGDEKAKQYLYPTELLQLISCEEVPIRWRVVFTLSVYLAVRAAELEALGWDDLDLSRGIVHVHRSVRRYTRTEKTTKTGAKPRFAIEPTLLPLLRALHRFTGGRGRVLGALGMPNKFELSKALRDYLALVQVTREELFVNDATRKWMTFHDLRATGLTWMAVRGDDPLKIKHRAGHKTFATTERYIRTAEELRDGFGSVFPELPRSLVTAFEPAVAAE